MALIFKNNLYGNIKIDSNKIIGVMGNNYVNFIHSIKNNNAYIISRENDFYTNSVDSEMLVNIKNKGELLRIKEIMLKEFNLDYAFLNKKISELSSGEIKLLKYILAFINNKKILIIDEPFMDLDYNGKKMIKSLLQRIIYETNKTIIIGSCDSNIIYELCSNVLLLDSVFYYDKTINIFKDINLLNRFNIDIPDLVKFVNLVKQKNTLIDYSFDIRDLIKDVYKSV